MAVLAAVCYGHAYAQASTDPTPVQSNDKAVPASPTKPSPPSTATAASLDAVVVTGSRTATTVGESATPVSVISAATLQSTGQANLRDALVQLSPSISRVAYGGDNALLTNTLSLDGLSPDHVLVLVNGKRRHGTANITQDGGLNQGSTGVDIDLIPVALIDHIEILRDGASAQYGSDAIAGVINIILKDKIKGGTLSSTSGQTTAGDGFKNSESASIGFNLAGNGFLDVSAEYDRQNHTVRTGPDYADGLYFYNTPPTTPVGPNYYNRIRGDSASTRQLVGFNGGYNFSNDVEVYSFGTYGHRYAEAYENFRPGYVSPQVYPNGFTPIYTIDENDYSITGGIKDSNLFGWAVDLSTTYGGDRDNLGLQQSVNTSLYKARGSSPTSFTLGATSNSQLTNTLDFTRPFELSLLASPLNLSFGFEQRRETYTIQAGEPASYQDGGSASEAGFAPINAGDYERNVFGTYVDLSTHLTSHWQVDVAGRYEHYSDAGNTSNGKFSTRYDFSPQVGLRASASTGFHAPSLAEEHFSSLGVSPASVSGELASNSAAAQSLGAQPLKPERATNLNLGLVLNPLQNLNITVDAYQITIRNRIVAGGSVSGEPAIAALVASGLPVSSSVNPANVSAWYFTNGADTRSRGLDLTSVYHADYAGFGQIDWDLAANINSTRITHLAYQGGKPELNAQQIAALTTVTPKNKIIVGGIWHLGRWGLSVHETRWGATGDQLSYYAGPNAFSVSQFASFRNTALYTTDIEARFDVTKSLQLALGGNNVFDRYPSKIPYINQLEGSQYDGSSSQVGFNGAYYYLRVGYKF